MADCSTGRNQVTSYQGRFCPEIPGSTLEELLGFWSQKGPEYEVACFDEIALGIAHCEQPGIAFLWNELEQADDQRISGVILGLTWNPAAIIDWLGEDGPRQLSEKLLRFVDEDRRAAIPEALRGLAYIDKLIPDSQFEECMSHEDKHVRAAALQYLARTQGHHAIPTLVTALDSPSSTLRFFAVDLLDDLDALKDDPSIADRVRSLLDDKDEDVRVFAQLALENSEIND